MSRSIKGKTYSFDVPATELPEVEEAAHLTIITKCPEKYILIDTETGQIYAGSNDTNPYMPYHKLWIEQARQNDC